MTKQSKRAGRQDDATSNRQQSAIYSQDGTNNNQTQLGKRETMQHPMKATQQAKTLIDETTQIELVEQANTLIINLYIDTVQSNTLLHN
jgi:hypothetical protein